MYKTSNNKNIKFISIILTVLLIFQNTPKVAYADSTEWIETEIKTDVDSRLNEGTHKPLDNTIEHIFNVQDYHKYKGITIKDPNGNNVSADIVGEPEIIKRDGRTTTLKVTLKGDKFYSKENPKKYSKMETDSKTTYNGTSFPSTLNYNSGGYKGSLSTDGSPVLLSGSYTPSQSKYVTAQTSQHYNSGGYTGTLSRYLYSGTYTPSDTKYVTGQTSSYYNSGGYSGSLSRYLYSGSYTPRDTKFITGRDSAYYNDGTYSGTLSRYLHGKEDVPEEDKYVSGIALDDKYWNSYWGPSHVDIIYDDYSDIDHLYENYVNDGFKGSLRAYGMSHFYRDVTIRSTNVIYSNSPSMSESYAKSFIYSSQVDPYFPESEFYIEFELGERESGDKGKTYGYPVKYRYNERFTHVKGYGKGTVVKPATTKDVYKYEGTVVRPESDTRVYRYRGDVTKPSSDTRVYRYQGNVTKPSSDTRTRRQDYKGEVYKTGLDEKLGFKFQLHYENNVPEVPEIIANTTKWTNKSVPVKIQHNGVHSKQLQMKRGSSDWIDIPNTHNIIVDSNEVIEVRALNSTTGAKDSYSKINIEIIDKQPPEITIRK